MTGTGLDVAAIAKAADSPAGSTFMRVLGLAVPNSLYEAGRRRLADRDARAKLDAVSIDEAVRLLSADPDKVDRMIQRMAGSEYRKQKNLESVTQAAILELGPEYLAPDEDVSSKADKIDDDWINVFSRYAEDASSDRLRDLFGRVLAGEIRKPGSFSPSLMRIISELDVETARDIQELAEFAWGDSIVLDEGWGRGQRLMYRQRLTTNGIIATEELNGSPVISDAGFVTFKNGNSLLLVFGPSGLTLQFDLLSITKAGCQLLSVISPSSKLNVAKAMAARLKERNANITKVELYDLKDGQVVRSTQIL